MRYLIVSLSLLLAIQLLPYEGWAGSRNGPTARIDSNFAAPLGIPGPRVVPWCPPRGIIIPNQTTFHQPLVICDGFGRCWQRVAPWVTLPRPHRIFPDR